MTSRAAEQSKRIQNDSKNVAFFNIEWKKWAAVRIDTTTALLPKLKEPLQIITLLKHEEGKALAKLIDKEIRHQELPSLYPLSYPSKATAYTGVKCSQMSSSGNHIIFNTFQEKVSYQGSKPKRSRSRSNDINTGIITVNNSRLNKQEKLNKRHKKSHHSRSNSSDINEHPNKNEKYIEHKITNICEKLTRKQQEEDWDDDLLGNHSVSYMHKNEPSIHSNAATQSNSYQSHSSSIENYSRREEYSSTKKQTS